MSETIVYTDPSTQTSISDILFWKDTIWMTQDQMSKLYNKVPSGISMHIQKIYQDGELKEAETSQSESKFRNTENT